MEETHSEQEDLKALTRAFIILRQRTPQIALAFGIVLALVILGILAAILIAPSERIASLDFRLNFQGAEQGMYPNGTEFRSSDIVATPILREVYRRREIQRYMDFAEFSRSVFVLESNEEIQRLGNEYRARLSERSLSAVDRERLEQEYRVKLQSLNRSEFSVNFRSAEGVEAIPEKTVTLVLADIVQEWADYAVSEKGALRYQIPLLTGRILEGMEFNEQIPLVSLDQLRSMAVAAGRNIEALREIPGASALRTSDGLSLVEIQLDVDEAVRARLNPQLFAIGAMMQGQNREYARNYVQSQLDHYKLKRDEANARAQNLQTALRLYTAETEPPSAMTSDASPGGRSGSGETLMPQLGESFLDRIVDMASASADRTYRQDMVDEIIQITMTSVPFQTEIAYYENLAGDLERGGEAGVSFVDPGTAFQRVREQLTGSLRSTREIYDLISANLNASQALYTIDGPARFDVIRSVSYSRLVLIAFLILLFSLIAIPLVVLIHYRMAQEETLDREAQAASA